MNDVYDISKAIHKYLTGKASTEERATVEKWLAESESHQKIMDSFRDEAYWEEERKAHQRFNIQTAYNRFRQAARRLSRRRIIPRIAAAAVITAALLGGSWLLWTQNQQTDSRLAIVNNEIKPGSSKATLIMGSGMTMHLEDSTNLKLDENNTQIDIQGGEVVYKQQDGENGDAIPPRNNTIYTPRGGEYKLTLADGTRVWLNAEAQISFPSAFPGKYREVSIAGEVYFEVAKNPEQPFLVKTEQSTVIVTGTSFNVRSYPNEAQRITLVEGKINVKHNDRVTPILPGEQWVLDENGPHVRKVKASSISGWKEGNFAFEDIPLDAVFGELERWYNIHVFFGNHAAQDITFTGIFPRYTDFSRVLEIIELAACVTCDINGRSVTVYLDNPTK